MTPKSKKTDAGEKKPGTPKKPAKAAAAEPLTPEPVQGKRMVLKTLKRAATSPPPPPMLRKVTATTTRICIHSLLLGIRPRAAWWRC